MFLVAVTGGIATGKSTVSRLLADYGCPVIDADEIARQGMSWMQMYNFLGGLALHWHICHTFLQCKPIRLT